MATVSDNFNRPGGDLDGSTASGGGLWVEFENTAWGVSANRARAVKGVNWLLWLRADISNLVIRKMIPAYISQDNLD